MLTGTYATLYERLSSYIPLDRLIHDELRTLAYGTDASFYRLIPKVVVRVENENEVIETLKLCNQFRIPVTFRAAGTSLSGQAISDSVLLMLGHSWKNYSILEDGKKIRLQPGVIGGHANVFLAPYGRKIGPDPASINSAMIGGIAANNASGMCCGVAQNSYQTLASMKIIFADGSLLDTGDEQSRKSFQQTHHQMIARITDLSERVRRNSELAERIRNKFKMKNTTGYSLNALVDFDDPIDIIQHLMIGSEGTLGFIAEITFHTVVEHPHKASSLMFFPDIKTACEAVAILKRQPVDAVELMDRASLRSVQDKQGMPPYLRDLDENVACLLVETRSADTESLRESIEQITHSIENLPKVRPIEFTDDPKEYTLYWNIRKGLFPALGYIRKIGTTVVIEDVAFPIERLAEATVELQHLFAKHGYTEAIIFGHALEGNLHFVFNQDFNSHEEVVRYRYFMDDVTRMVVQKYDGALKAEHGTGRNMAPFVEMEWGREAYQLMKEIKNIFDPKHILNPGVILNDDPLAHLRNLKPMPAAHEIIDRCIECGFCEIQCPSRDLTLTPRQRIVVWREMTRLANAAEDPVRLSRLRALYTYHGDQTCATDGMCATTCPVDIDTGKLIKVLRKNSLSPTSISLADVLAHHLDKGLVMARLGLGLVNGVHTVIGARATKRLNGFLWKVSGRRIPIWSEFTPRAAHRIRTNARPHGQKEKILYVPSCVSRTFGIFNGYTRDKRSQVRVTESLLTKAGYAVVYPENINKLCCGLAFSSKGFTRQGDLKSQEMEEALRTASNNGSIPILMDTSPCVQRMKEQFDPQLQIYDPSLFVLEFLQARLSFSKVEETVMVHVPCSSQKMGLQQPLLNVARLCAENVVSPQFIACCGFAGDRGFYHPELVSSALNSLDTSLPGNIRHGYSTSRGCEIGLSMKSGIPFVSLMYLVDYATTSRS